MLRDAPSVRVQSAKTGLGIGVGLFSSPAVPPRRLGIVLGRREAALIHVTEAELRITVQPSTASSITIFGVNVESYRRRAALDRKRGPGRPPTHATIKEKG